MDEEIVAKRAKDMLQVALARGVQSFKEHLKRNKNPKRKPLKNFKLNIKVRKTYKTNDGGSKKFFNAIVLDMGKHGFIHNYGADTIRQGHAVKREKPKSTIYYRNAHNYRLEKNNFIDRAIEESGVIPYVAKEIGEIRGYEVLQGLLDKMADRINHNQK